MISFTNSIFRSYSDNPSVPTGVDHLAARLFYRTQLFDPVRRERFSSGGDSEHIAETFRARNRCVRYIRSLSVTNSVIDTKFQEDSCATFSHDLLCVCGTDASKYWFMTAAEDWLEVTEYLRARDGSNTINAQSMSLQELSQLPFNVYFHVQKKGDLVILPLRRSGHPRSLCSPTDSLPSYSQTIHRGVTASLCWERVTFQGLESFIYHDRIFKQRYDDCGPLFLWADSLQYLRQDSLSPPPTPL